MSETKNTREHKNSAGPVGLDDLLDVHAWKKTADESLGRYRAWLGQMAELQRTSFEQMSKVIEERSKMVTESLACAQKLTTEWSRLTTDATRRVADLVKSQS
ncbi:MAG: hypothetical protein HY903_19215 [Deltaproteobacteria bacterium]|nr:hypothetical protein [Deltaproteobacteria bacterium]